MLVFFAHRCHNHRVQPTVYNQIMTSCRTTRTHVCCCSGRGNLCTSPTPNSLQMMQLLAKASAGVQLMVMPMAGWSEVMAGQAATQHGGVLVNEGGEVTVVKRNGDMMLLEER